MLVRELAEKLKGLDQDQELYVWSPDGKEVYPVKDVQDRVDGEGEYVEIILEEETYATNR